MHSIQSSKRAMEEEKGVYDHFDHKRPRVSSTRLDLFALLHQQALADAIASYLDIANRVRVFERLCRDGPFTSPDAFNGDILSMQQALSYLDSTKSHMRDNGGPVISPLVNKFKAVRGLRGSFTDVESFFDRINGDIVFKLHISPHFPNLRVMDVSATILCNATQALDLRLTRPRLHTFVYRCEPNSSILSLQHLEAVWLFLCEAEIVKVVNATLTRPVYDKIMSLLHAETIDLSSSRMEYKDQSAGSLPLSMSPNVKNMLWPIMTYTGENQIADNDIFEVSPTDEIRQGLSSLQTVSVSDTKLTNLTALRSAALFPCLRRLFIVIIGSMPSESVCSFITPLLPQLEHLRVTGPFKLSELVEQVIIPAHVFGGNLIGLHVNSSLRQSTMHGRHTLPVSATLQHLALETDSWSEEQICSIRGPALKSLCISVGAWFTFLALNELSEKCPRLENLEIILQDPSLFYAKYSHQQANMERFLPKLQTFTIRIQDASQVNLNDTVDTVVDPNRLV